jgi:hypothetical protein
MYSAEPKPLVPLHLYLKTRGGFLHQNLKIKGAHKKVKSTGAKAAQSQYAPVILNYSLLSGLERLGMASA